MEFLVKLSSNAGCEAISCSKALSTRDTLKLTYNSKSEVSYNVKNLQSPCLTYDEKRFTNRIISSFLGDTVIRKIVLTNTGSGVFDGYVKVKDIFGPYVSVIDISVANADHSDVAYSLANDSTGLFQAKINNLKNGDSLFIIEKVVINKCIKGEEGKSQIYVNWGCDVSACKKISPYPIIAQILKSMKRPEILITKVISDESNCLNSHSTYSYVIKNIGQRPATDLIFKLASADYNTYTYVHRDSLKLKDTSGLKLLNSVSNKLIPGVPAPFGFEHSCIINDPLYNWMFTFENLFPGDSFIVEYDAFHCCPGADTANVPVSFEGWVLGVDYKDECKEQSFNASSNQEGNPVAEFKQFYEQIITDMNGRYNERQKFEIFNYGFSTDFYRLNIDSSAFKVVLKVDTGLVYLPETLKILSTYGKSITASDIKREIGGGVDGYKDSMLVATFILPDTFELDKNYFTRFMRNSSVLFDLQAECPTRSPVSRFTQELYLIPDVRCNQACDILLSSVTSEISVHCPGCITPGWVATAFNQKRITLGEKDEDNNRLPDSEEYIKADPAKIKANRFLPGDTVVTTLSAFFQDGDPIVGRTIQDLENNGAKSFKFDYAYVSSKNNMGKLFSVTGVKVLITDLNGSTGNHFEPVYLPASTVTKVSNVNDSLSDALFFYDLSLDTLYKYGLPKTYSYGAFDQIRIESTFRVLEFSDFYLTNPPSDNDPWLKMEQQSVNMISYSNLLYGTGEKDTPYDKDADAGAEFPKNPDSLDGSMIYWCEAYGGAASMLGRVLDKSITLPEKVQCDVSGSIKISVNPSGGIFRNPFPNEFRNLLKIDSVFVTVPEGYEFRDWTISNTVNKPDGFLEFEPCVVTDSLKNVNEAGPYIKIKIDERFTRLTDYGNSPCLDRFTYSDEEASVLIKFNIHPQCDLQDEKTVIYDSPVLYYKLIPKNDTLFKLKKLPTVLKVNPELKLSPVTNEIQLTRKTFCYPLNMEEMRGADAPYSFLRVVSMNEKIQPIGIKNKETKDEFFPDRTGLFQLGTIGSKTVSEYELCLNNICGKLLEKDTLLLIYGFDCYNYPDSVFSNICKFDTIRHYVVPAELNIQSQVGEGVDVEMCKPFSVDFSYQITGIGQIENMFLKLNSGNVIGINLQDAGLLIGQNSEDILNDYSKEDARFDLQRAIGKLKPEGIKAGDNIKISLKMIADCAFKGDTISSTAMLLSSTCDTIYGDTLKYIPKSLKGFPKEDDKFLSVDYKEVNNLGGLWEVSIKVKNNSTETSQNKTRVTFTVPEGFVFSAMNKGASPTITDTLLTWNLNGGILPGATQDLIFSFSNDPIACDSINVSAKITDLLAGCSGDICEQKDSVNSFKVPVKCNPCAPTIEIQSRCKGLPIENKLIWNEIPDSYCPEDNFMVYDVYYSPNRSGAFKMIMTQKDSTVFTHKSLTTFDGCYYVTATNSLGHTSDKSSVVCNNTCKEQFDCSDLFIPNLITLNGDEKNEIFQIMGGYVPIKLEIYDRWGSRVYNNEDYKNDWAGIGLNDALFYYNISVDGSDKNCVGWIQVVRGDKIK
ncbi:MAG: gliding motility-associated C-terminal domain-containing protein [Sporocytophaga sp.]|nr:gliding motility-associated C-terminal domain-containing protein [Sporocytophaga sp.]